MKYHNYPHQKYTKKIINKLKLREQHLLNFGYSRTKAHKEISAQSEKLIGIHISVNTIYLWLTPQQWEKKRIVEKRRYQRNPEIFKERTRKWRRNNPELYHKQIRNHLKTYYPSYYQSKSCKNYVAFKSNPLKLLCQVMMPKKTYSIDELTSQISSLSSHNFKSTTVRNALDGLIEQSIAKARYLPIIKVSNDKYQINTN